MGPRSLSRAWMVMLVSVFLPSCQDFVFEEVPGSVFKTKRMIYDIPVRPVDILFVVDDSGSMAAEQVQLGQSFKSFVNILEESGGSTSYQIALITTGVESDREDPDCPICTEEVKTFCIYSNSDGGPFVERLGHIESWTGEIPNFTFTEDPTCKLIQQNNLSCFYDEDKEQGVVLVSTLGCGFERGLSSMKRALEPGTLRQFNPNFLRKDANLAVIVVSDEEDCGEPGQLRKGAKASECYYASKGIKPDGTPADDSLEPVESYYQFLLSLKGGRKDHVQFAAIVGMKDAQDPSSTVIEFASNDPSAKELPVCSTLDLGCTGQYCVAFPGTRYIQLAERFGLGGTDNDYGFLDTICQSNFSNTMEKVAKLIACKQTFDLTEPLLDPALANIMINGEFLPKYTCSIQNQLKECAGPDQPCPEGDCVKTWIYTPADQIPGPNPPQGGRLSFAKHYNPCLLTTNGVVHIEVIYATQ
jgi:hypothetical protein